MASPTPETNGKIKEIFYGYMYDDPKPDEIPIPKPKPLLDALLRALALHIINDIGDKDEKHLAPAKMAAFYKLAGHDYDRLFVNMPPQSISFIYQVQGCQHILLPTEDDFAAPSIPALTVKGFARWQAIQILLEPQTHVPIVQFAVKNWSLKHPEFGTVFPDDLPATVFPVDTDQDTDLWHQSCATKLRAEATTREEPQEEREAPGADLKADDFSDAKVPFSHVRPKASGSQDYDYFKTRSGPVPVSYVRPPERTDRYDPRRSPERPREPERERTSDIDPDPLDHVGRGRYAPPRKVFSSEEERTSRRPSFTDYPHIIPQETQSMQIPLRTDRISVPRRLSQPRHYTSPSSSDAEVEPATSRSGRRHHSRSSRDSREPPPVSTRRVFNSDGVPSSRAAAMGGRSISPRSHSYSRREPPIAVVPATTSSLRADDSKRKGIGSGIKDKISNLFPGVSIVGDDRRSRSRGQKDDRVTGPDRAVRELYRDSRHKSYSDDESDLTESENDVDRRRRAKRSKESRILDQRDIDRERERDIRIKSRDRDRERDRDRDHDRDRVRDRSTRDRDRDRYRDLDSDELEPTSRRDRDRERSRGISTGTLRRDREHRERHTDRDDEDDGLDLSHSPHSSRSGGRASGARTANGPYLAQADLERRTGSRADIDRRDWTGGSGGSMLGGRVDTQDRYRDSRDRERDRDREGRWGSRDEMRSRERPLHRERLSSPSYR
ncbi:uncharacterized protein B0T23DRAFT_71671 [Neurospora hispaniola]|uniref:DUF7514 domain-containing protein n=1 Tax=Neurospora hispaniola TaxID=588809 RepID=A0AAJ0IC29_9PEZI|nr:hypothetical protein B0T23DRAFT_71671 [Neurospora hispaniola]